jgi:hypothetical protein
MVNPYSAGDASPPPKRRAWSSPSEVAPGTGVARQLELMHELIGARISGPEFARAWLAARRRALDEKERVRERFDRILTDVFYLLDDYVIDPSLRDAGDMTDEDLIERVRNALHDLSALDVD